MKQIAVLIPCLNEGKTIYDVVTEFKELLPYAKIYVYDNGSKDDTISEVIRAGAVLGYEVKKGKGNVIRKMFRNIDADIYVMCDGDATYDISKVKKMVDLVAEGCDMVIGNRMAGGYEKENKKWLHIRGNRLVNKLVRHIYGGKFHDVMSGFRVFSKRFVKTFPAISDGFEIETEMILFAINKKIAVKEIPVVYKEHDLHESKVNTVIDGIKIIKTIFESIPKYKPYYLLWNSVVLVVIGILVKVFGSHNLASVFCMGCAMIVAIFVLILHNLEIQDRQIFEINFRK